MLAGVVGLPEGGVAVDVAAVDHPASLRPAAASPEIEASVFADEGSGQVGRAGVVERRAARTWIARDREGVVALVVVTLPIDGPSAPTRALARDGGPHPDRIRRRCGRLSSRRRCRRRLPLRRCGRRFRRDRNRLANEGAIAAGAHELVGDPTRGSRGRPRATTSSRQPDEREQGDADHRSDRSQQSK